MTTRDILLMLAGWFFGIATFTIGQQIAAASRARRSRAARFARFRRIGVDLAAPDSSRIRERTYPDLPLADSSPDAEATKLSRRA